MVGLDQDSSVSSLIPRPLHIALHVQKNVEVSIRN